MYKYIKIIYIVVLLLKNIHFLKCLQSEYEIVWANNIRGGWVASTIVLGKIEKHWPNINDLILNTVSTILIVLIKA